MEAKQKLESLLDELSKVNKLPRLSAAARDVDRIIELLSEAREQIAGRECSRPQLPKLQHSPRPQQWTPTPPA